MTLTQLAASAKAGELFLDPTAEREVLQACTELETELQRIIRDLQEGLQVQPFGTLPSGIYFGNLFQQKIFGQEESVISRIQDMIGETRKMREVFEQSFHNFRNSDQATRDRLTQLEKEM